MPGSSNQQQLDLAIAQLGTLRRQTREKLVISHHALEEELSIRPSALLKQIDFQETIGAEANEDAVATAGNKLEKFQEVLQLPLLDTEEVTGGHLAAKQSIQLPVSRLRETPTQGERSWRNSATG